MARVKLILPEKRIFQTTIPVMVGDINYGGHLGNDRVLTVMHEARLRFVRSLGYEDEVTLGPNIALYMADSVVVYRSEAFQGDRLLVSLALADFSAYGMDIFYKLETEDREVARGKTGMVFFNTEAKKIAKVPGSFTEKIERLQPV